MHIPERKKAKQRRNFTTVVRAPMLCATLDYHPENYVGQDELKVAVRYTYGRQQTAVGVEHQKDAKQLWKIDSNC